MHLFVYLDTAAGAEISKSVAHAGDIFSSIRHVLRIHQRARRASKLCYAAGIRHISVTGRHLREFGARSQRPFARCHRSCWRRESFVEPEVCRAEVRRFVHSVGWLSLLKCSLFTGTVLVTISIFENLIRGLSVGSSHWLLRWVAEITDKFKAKTYLYIFPRRCCSGILISALRSLC